MAARAVRTSATDHFAIISGIEKIATDIYSFENLRKGGYVYVDKTDLLWRLASEKEGRQFFISRPRRFGKSLMLSTLKCLFEGRKDLFRGLKIEKRRWAWKTTYPVVMLDMSKAKASTPEALEAVLLGMVLRLARSVQGPARQDGHRDRRQRIRGLPRRARGQAGGICRRRRRSARSARRGRPTSTRATSAPSRSSASTSARRSATSTSRFSRSSERT